MAPNSLPFAPSRRKVKSLTALLTLIVLISMVLVACGGGTTQNNQTSSKQILKIAPQSYDFSQSRFNPFNTHPNAGILGLVFETLYFVNLNRGAVQPNLATT